MNEQIELFAIDEVTTVSTKEQLLKLSPEELIALHNNNKSETIRYLTSLSLFTTSQIAKMLDIRYQFVRNVQTTKIRKK